MRRKLKTVPLKQLLGEPSEKPRGLRIGIAIAVVADLLIAAALIWKLTR